MWPSPAKATQTSRQHSLQPATAEGASARASSSGSRGSHSGSKSSTAAAGSAGGSSSSAAVTSGGSDARATALPHGTITLLSDPALVSDAYSTESLGAVASLNATSEPPVTGATLVPRHIYTFWDRTIEMPSFVAACIALMRDGNPGYDVTVLHERSDGFEAPPDTDAARNDFALNNALMADWYRLAAIYQYGGIWLDATVLTVHAAENTWMDALQYDGVTGYYCDGTHAGDPGPECMESFVFSAPKHNPLIGAWLDETRNAITMGCSAYGGTLEPEVLGDIGLPRLCVYAAFRQARHKNPSAVLTLRDAAACANSSSGTPGHQPICGPYHYMEGKEEFGGPKLGGLVEELFTGTGADDFATTPLVKFPSAARNYVLGHETSTWLAPGSYLGGLLVAALPESPPAKLMPDYSEPPPFFWDSMWSGVIVAAPLCLCLGGLAMAWWVGSCRPNSASQPNPEMVKKADEVRP